ncbi:hypothetical protein D3C75_879400 [compost metagenome]
MHVVTAGVHDGLFGPVAVDLTRGRGVGEAGVFGQRQAVHVGADHDGRTGPVLEHCDHARPADAGRDLIAQGAQFPRHAGGGLDLHARQLGVAVEVVEQGAEVGVVVGLDRRLQPGVLSRYRRGARRQNRRQNGRDR